MTEVAWFRSTTWDRWFNAVLAVVWAGVTLLAAVGALSDGKWLMAPLILPFGAIAPWYAWRTWRAGLVLGRNEMVFTPLIGRKVTIPRAQVQRFQEITTARGIGPWCSLEAVLFDGFRIDTRVGASSSAETGRAQVAAMAATANAWAAG